MAPQQRSTSDNDVRAEADPGTQPGSAASRDGDGGRAASGQAATQAAEPEPGAQAVSCPSEDAELSTFDATEQPPEPAARTGVVSRLRRGAVGAAIAAIGASIPFLMMASDWRWRYGVPVGVLGCTAAALGILEALGSFDDPECHVVHRAETSRLGVRLAELLAAAATLVAVLHLAVAGVLGPGPTAPGERPMVAVLAAAILVTGSFLWGVVAVFRVGQALGVERTASGCSRRPLLQHHGFWLVTLITLLYLPQLGSHSLIDPWETHYGEVTREMLARDDWISLWWAQDGWFWSKPILTFWLQGLCFSLLGVRYQPDQMLASVAEGRFPQPEWAARMPIFVLMLVGVYLLYKGVAQVFGRRAGLLGGIVLATTPYWYFLSHQSMTDMPYVGTLAGAMGLFLLGFHTDPEARVRVFEVTLGARRFRLSAYHLLFVLVLLCVLPQVLYLASRNVTLQLEAVPHGFRPHADEFFAGSGGGNCGLPGNRACRTEVPVNPVIQPVYCALLWAAIGGVLLWLGRGERRAQRLYFVGAWLCVALSAMAKGAPGLVLGVLVPLAYLGATRRWRQLIRLELGMGLLLLACIILPWYTQMYLRHGQPFTDRLLFHDMYKRAFVHVHDTNQGVDLSFRYYVWQLGYGLFPWTGLCAAGLVWWMRIRAHDRRHDVAVFLVLWFILAFSMFAVSLTKFHHYILPAVPPAAMLTGLVLDRALGLALLPRRGRLVVYLGGSACGVALLVYGITRLLLGDAWGTAGTSQQLSWSPTCRARGQRHSRTVPATHLATLAWHQALW